MLLQRSSPAESLAPVFGVMEILTGVGLMAGTGLAQTTIAIGGAPLTLIVFGIGVAGVLAVVARKVWSADDAADVPIVAIRLLRSVSVFQPLPPLTLEAIARSSQERRFATGEVLVDVGEVRFGFAAGRKLGGALASEGLDAGETVITALITVLHGIPFVWVTRVKCDRT